MNGLPAWLAAHGLALPDRTIAIEAGIALALVLASLALGLWAGRRFGPVAQSAWKARLGTHAEGLGARATGLIRHGVAALLLAILLAAGSWHPLAVLPIGLALGAATARLTVQVLRGLGMPRWMAWVAAFIVFVALFSHALGGLKPITDALEAIGFDAGKRRFSLLTVIVILVTVIGLLAAIRLANRLIAHTITQARDLDPTQKLLAQKLAGIAVIVIAFFVGVDLLDINLTTFAVFSGAFGLAIGFGLQKTIGNLIAGIILLMDRSIKPGDVIVVGENVGVVNKIGVRAVSVVTRDGKEHLIPNENLMTQEVENWSYTDRNVRVRITVNVAYDCDLPLAQELMLRAANESPRVLDSPKPNVWLTAFGESAIEHEIRVWISDPEGGVGNVRSDVLYRVWKLFREHAIALPYPQRDIHIRSLPPNA